MLSRSLNLEITRLDPQTCPFVLSRSLNLVLSLGQNRQSKNSILENNSYYFHRISNEDKLYIKVIALDTVYNFVVEFFFI